MDEKKGVLIMATNNEHKLREIRQILAGRFEVRGLVDIGCHEDIPETTNTLEGNALQKVRYVHEHYGVDCFADDTGLEVEALDGAPGIYTARFGHMNGYGDSHDSDANIRCLLDKLKDKDNRHARFRTAIALIKDGEEHLFEGIVEGEILKERTGTDGFGYDPIFAPTEAGVSFAEMGSEEKNRISHRGRATQKLAAFLKLLILFFLFALPTSMLAQRIGEWQVYPSYCIARKSISVGKSVYVLTIAQEQVYTNTWQTYNLMQYDTEDTSVKTYNSLETLNDQKISHIAYSADAKRLIIVYQNGNIDLIDSDDNVQNIASLKQSTLSDRQVNNVYIDGTTAYLATGFGYITVDMSEGVIRDTYRLGLDVHTITILDSKIYLGTTSGIYCSTTENLHVIGNWSLLNTHNTYQQMVVFEGEIYMMNENGVHHFQKSDNSFQTIFPNGQCRFLTVANNQLIFGCPQKIFVYSAATNFQSFDMENNWYDLSYADGLYWACEGNDGLKGYKFSADGFAEKVGSIKPNSPVRSLAYRMQYVGDRLLVSGGINTPYAIYNAATAMYYEDGQWTNFDEEGPATKYPSLHHWNTTHVVQDPNDPTHHFASPYRTGLYEYRNGKFVGLYNSDNSPLRQIKNYGLNYVGCSGLQYDADGNLWMMNQRTDTIIRILQPSGRWLSLYYSEIDNTPTPDDFLFTTSGVKFLLSRRVDGRGIFGFHTNGTLNTVRDDKHLLRTTITNQDGTSYTPDEFYSIAEDMDGRVWVGTIQGLFVINDPTTFFDSDFKFEQIKISRNDGSNLADYLLSGVAITAIAVDGANRKWIGTANNGLYLISDDGQEMIHHFDTDNSPILSNSIRSLAIHHTTGRVMIGTDAGLCSYISDATEAEDELKGDSVYSYPNPVSPDYTGPIAVHGLTMDGEVKICSSTGQLVWSGHSNGGTFTWNGLNKNGRRVSSGVYQVIANTAEGKKAVVCRIIVIH